MEEIKQALYGYNKNLVKHMQSYWLTHLASTDLHN